MEVTRGYLFEEQEEKYQDQLKKVYTFMKTPRELEKVNLAIQHQNTKNTVLFISVIFMFLVDVVWVPVMCRLFSFCFHISSHASPTGYSENP